MNLGLRLDGERIAINPWLLASGLWEGWEAWDGFVSRGSGRRLPKGATGAARERNYLLYSVSHLAEARCYASGRRNRQPRCYRW
jgi:hypothetical protein